jgi:hypothetical protein
MELELREIAHNMARQRAAQAEFGQNEQGETAHFAHAAARVLQGLSVNQVKRCGEDLIDLIDREVPVAALQKLANREKPSLVEMRAVARQLAAKRAKQAQLDNVFAWVGELFGLDPAEITILTIFARWGNLSAGGSSCAVPPCHAATSPPVPLLSYLALPTIPSSRN